MRILICDDDPVFCDELERDLEQYEIIHRLEFEILKVFSGEQALDALAQGDWDVLFMDIEMPTINGVEAGKRVREQLQNYSLKIIYVSSRQEYAMDLFKVDTFDFLIKPVAYEELEAVLDKLQKTLDRNGEMFVYRKKGQAVRCRLEDILYFESWLKKTIIVTRQKEDEFYAPLKDIYEELKDKKFFYCHKSILVNYDRVAEFHYDRLVLDNGKELEISQSKRKEVRRLSGEMGMES
ncbi:LytR/AlgR family response regulator transcription factor [Aristaeella lactis]|jgi:DNA-binding LytR/AlgR family response regulator|uniref:Two component transcriptional regulator, LytTR family n=1 Tax=Aristaeella lactis TaxID=3046383 RepID=A0AC61PP98_9FIRM|nr:LytTR family DNA-binding domain-containing protein [Aristaeella lactis]QUA54458.1 response regulator transcription factor [Aristaeella lactis]SMC82843.1 two component transcriptional regulator, LytTR family [Aristaeella lactis]